MTLALFDHVIAQEMRMQISLTSVTLDVDCGLCAYVEHGETRRHRNWNKRENVWYSDNEYMYSLDSVLMVMAGTNSTFWL
jgi:hypothetical protein